MLTNECRLVRKNKKASERYEMSATGMRKPAN